MPPRDPGVRPPRRPMPLPPPPPQQWSSRPTEPSIAWKVLSHGPVLLVGIGIGSALANLPQG